MTTMPHSVGSIAQSDSSSLALLPACRSCGSSDLTVFLPLGLSPLANGILADDFEGDEPRYPLDVAFCRTCALAQLTFAPPPSDLFLSYPYLSSFSDTMVRHAHTLAMSVIERRGLRPDSLVVELASNDGYLLKAYRSAGIPVLGVEPAENIAAIASNSGVPTICEFFGQEVATRLAGEGHQADVIHAHNVLAHVPDINSFVSGIKTLLKPDGIGIIEAPYLRDLIENTEFDTVYHEHVFYFSATALDALFRRHGLRLLELERVDIHGGSLRVTVGHADSPQPASLSVERILKQESTLGMASEEYYRDFGARVAELRRDLRHLLTLLKHDGSSIAAYGASAKGTTLLTYCGIGSETLTYVVDRSTVKQGSRTPGTHLIIRDPEFLLEDMPDYCLLLVWNFADEVMRQQSEYIRRGGKFIIPLPHPRVVPA
jgi:SAM-dependent methyltransferase